ncbi:hypothetical protein [Delftia tsuruhatensis]|uniref:hypothetical protein n=1 Tax=Delftia tsuruhatensis TaxID=180282 RepID=UPI003A8445B3
MRTDPRKGCANETELWLWAAIHDLLAHPLMVLTWYSRLSLRFHDFTSHRAWPRARPTPQAVAFEDTPFGDLKAVPQAPGVWRVHHGRVNHAITLQAKTAVEACAAAQKWFHTLADEFGGKFAAEYPHG